MSGVSGRETAEMRWGVCRSVVQCIWVSRKTMPLDGRKNRAKLGRNDWIRYGRVVHWEFSRLGNQLRILGRVLGEM